MVRYWRPAMTFPAGDNPEFVVLRDPCLYRAYSVRSTL